MQENYDRYKPGGLADPHTDWAVGGLIMLAPILIPVMIIVLIVKLMPFIIPTVLGGLLVGSTGAAMGAIIGTGLLLWVVLRPKP